MNTNHLKKFAQEARRKLLEQVGAKLSFVLTTDSAELREKTEQLKQLREELGRTTKEQLIEKVAYTWFNRLMAIRFMDANDYQPIGIRVITPKDGYTIPEILDEAKRGNISAELKLNRQKVYDLLDNRIPSTNPQNEAFKALLIAACNFLNETFPFLFEKINDYSELLLPDDLTSTFSIVNDVIEGMQAEDCKNVEIIGWLYQFYISEEKDRLINAKKKYQAHEIAPVTQLFTPKWIVQYMVENTLAQYWKESRPYTKILQGLEFYIEPDGENLIPKREIKSPEDITFFDPCVGSAHILCYAFDVFYKIYEEEGYNGSDIPELIITKNLFGTDIDERAVQLAGFALMMKGRQYYRRFLRKGITPNIIAFKNSETYSKFKNAQSIGSLIKVNQDDIDKIIIEENSIFSEQHKKFKTQATYLATTYDIVVTNPPYLNSSYMDSTLKEYISSFYSETKEDLFACFLNQVHELTKQDGLIGFICPFVWMFTQSYFKLRNKIISEATISNLIQLEYNSFGPAAVAVCTFTLRNKYFNKYYGSYIRLSDIVGENLQSPSAKKAISKGKESELVYIINQEIFETISGSPIAYWLRENEYKAFLNKKFGDITSPKQGLITADNNRFLRFWYELNKDTISPIPNSLHEPIHKWYIYNKGGDFRRWYGNLIFVVNWEKDGYEIKNFCDESGKVKSRPQNIEYFFKEGITWSDIATTLGVAGRWLPAGCIFDGSGPSAFMNVEYQYLILGLLNSSFIKRMGNVLNPTLHFTLSDFSNLPLPHNEKNYKEIEVLVREAISISKIDWDSKEISVDYQRNSLLEHNTNNSLDEAVDNYIVFWSQKVFTLYSIENKLNTLINEAYELDSDEDKIPLPTICQDVMQTNIQLSLNDPINASAIQRLFSKYEILKNYISIFAGCLFGRFGLETVGLINANQSSDLNNTHHKALNSNTNFNFNPDEDNIVPVLTDDWFEDDIVGRFKQFLIVTFGEKNFNKNLSFIEEQIGKDIRKYFIKDFYPDHIKRYRKRPIYWMFSSSKGSFNVLIYMHRYTPDTISNILNKYLKEFIGKLNTSKEHLQNVQVTGSASDKTKAIKEIDNIEKMLVELREYERDVLYPLATERIEINLDDGVMVNYNKFGKAVKEVNGLNDPATKKKVKQFDWIDTTQIR